MRSKIRIPKFNPARLSCCVRWPLSVNPKRNRLMKKELSLAAAFALVATAAYGSAAMDKCVEDTTALGAKDPKAQCQCFVDALSDEDAAAYAEIDGWDEANDAMKEAGADCFPELN